jgi:5'-3' exonuclease
MRTYIYVDGFNLYYRSLKNTPYKWLDLKALFRYLLDPKNDIQAIKYFTARVSG